jgi:hypothetical protein
MRTRLPTILTLAAILALLAAMTFSATVLGAPTTLTATLAGGAAEVPPGDPDGAGTASVVIDPAAGTACYTITTQNIDPATASHIHVGAAGVAGAVVVPLDTDGFTGTTQGCTQGQPAAALQAVIDNPAGHYVNVHTDPYRGGAVRGQLAAGMVPNTALPVNGDSPVVLGLVLLSLALVLGAWRLAEQRR